MQDRLAVLSKVRDFLSQLEKKSLSPEKENQHFAKFLNELLQKVKISPAYEEKSSAYEFLFTLKKFYDEGKFFAKWLKPSKNLKPIFDWLKDLNYLPEPILLSVCTDLCATTLYTFETYAYAYHSGPLSRIEKINQRLSEVLSQLFENYVKQYVYDPSTYVQRFQQALTSRALKVSDKLKLEAELTRNVASLAKGLISYSPDYPEFFESVGPAYLHALQVAKQELASLITLKHLKVFKTYEDFTYARASANLSEYVLEGVLKNYAYLVLFDSIANQPDFQVRRQFFKLFQALYLSEKYKAWTKRRPNFKFPEFYASLSRKGVVPSFSPSDDGDPPYLHVILDGSFYVVQSILDLKKKPLLIKAFSQYFTYGTKCLELLKNGVDGTRYVCPTYKERLMDNVYSLFHKVFCVFEHRLLEKVYDYLPDDDATFVINLAENVKNLYQRLQALSPNDLIAFNLLLRDSPLLPTSGRGAFSAGNPFFEYFFLHPKIFTKIVRCVERSARAISRKLPTLIEYYSASNLINQEQESLSREIETLKSKLLEVEKNRIKQKILPPLNAGRSLV